MNNMDEVINRHRLSRVSLMRLQGWNYEQARRKVTNERGWTADEIERAGMWLRANGVPVTDRDVRRIVKPIGT